uniref:Uncharacterized protein n=1 Tax=Rhizophora mucronata TaxID=61149 RepID=A0A2P2KR62_RHIMU
MLHYKLSILMTHMLMLSYVVSNFQAIEQLKSSQMDLST